MANTTLKGVTKKGITSTAKKSTAKPSAASTLKSSSGIAEQLAAIEKAKYTPMDYTSVINPTARTSAELSDMYGITYDRQAIENILTNANNAKYDTLYKEQANTERNYGNQLSDTQRTLADTLRQQQAQAIMSGASKGSQAANQLSAMLGVSQESMQGMTELAQARGLLASQKGADQALAVSNALTQSNMAAQQLADLSKALQSNEIQQQAAQLTYNANVNTTNEDYTKALAQAREDLLANYYTGVSNQNVADINGKAMVDAYKNYGLNAANVNSASYSGSSSYGGGSGGGGGSNSGSSTAKAATAANSVKPTSALTSYNAGSPLSTKGYLTTTDNSAYQTIKNSLLKPKATPVSTVPTGHFSQTPTSKLPKLDTTKPTMPKIKKK